MTTRINTVAVQQAKDRIFAGDYRINTPWRDARPTDKAAQAYIAQHGWEAYAAWHLQENLDAAPQTLERYSVPVGDLKSVHRSALIAIKDDILPSQQPELAAAIDDILFMFDRLTAC